jgi:predicted ATPase/DNA-binding winged helix-turn-helix (wHTH) protein
MLGDMASSLLSAVSPAERLHIGGFVLDRTRRELLAPNGRPAELRHKALEVLLLLGAHAGHVVSKDDLLGEVWPDVVVTEDSLTQAIAEIRRCLGDAQHRWLRTAVRRGYCLHAEAEPQGDDASMPVAPSPAAVRTLPPMHAPPLGRDADRAAVQAALREARLVTLAGAGGIGKTSLALAVCHDLAQHSQRNLWWVDLALAPDALPLAPTIAAAARIDLPPGDPAAALAGALRLQPGLLVLDNCEHRIDEVAALAAALIAGTTQLHLLATSQEPLKISGEHVYRLATLECPAAGATLDQARRSPAFALLEQRAREADHAFGIDAGSLAAAIELCHRLDGMALALEMAAARLPSLGASSVLRLLDERLTLLKRARRDAPARHETLQATLAWSCSLLGAADRAALYCLAVFAGPFESAMAHGVIAPEASEAACVETLCALVDKSLLRVEPGEPARWRLYESMRLHARAQLRDSGGDTAARLRHGLAMAAHAGALRRTRSDKPDEAVLDRFGASYADFEQAFVHACERQDAEVAAQTLEALRRLDQLRGELSATERRLTAVLPLLAQAQGLARALMLSTRASSGWVKLPQWPPALAAEQAVQAWRALGSHDVELHHSLLLLGTERARLGDCAGAQQAIDEASAFLRTAGNLSSQRFATFVHQGHVAIMCGRWLPGLESLRTALALARQAGKTRLACYVLVHLVDAALLAGDARAALDYSESAVGESRACHAREYLAIALLMRVDAALAAGALDVARDTAREALPLAADYRLHHSIGAVFARLAMCRGATAPACVLLGYARAQPQGSDQQSLHEAAQLDALRGQAEAALGSAAVASLLRQGEQLDTDALLALAAEVA